MLLQGLIEVLFFANCFVQILHIYDILRCSNNIFLHSLDIAGRVARLHRKGVIRLEELGTLHCGNMFSILDSTPASDMI